jgi:arylsulfatase A-like enzyme
MKEFTRPSRRSFLRAALTTTGLTVCGGVGWAKAKKRPNMILIVLDDVGFSDLGCFGGEIRTPNIDRLAKSGLRYTGFDSRAVCSATRAALLTGRNSQTVGMADIPFPGVKPGGKADKNSGYIPLNAQMLPAALKQAGYSNWAVGKWHLTPAYEEAPHAPHSSWPTRRGFDYFYGFLKGWTDQYHPDLIENETVLPRPDRPGYHLSEDLIDKSIALINEQDQRAPDKPFFLYLGLGAAHSPIQVPARYSDGYAGLYDKGWDKLRVERFDRMKAMGVIPADTVLPPHNDGDRMWADLSDDERTVFARFMEVYAGFIEHADEQIGRLLDHLKTQGLDQDTLVMLISDNGAAGEAGQTGAFQRLYAMGKQPSIHEQKARLAELGTDKTQSQYQRPWAMAGNTPFRRYKVWPWLGGVRVPLVVSWPGKISDPGAIRRQHVDVIDIAPTLVEAAGTAFAKSVDGVAQIPVAGASMMGTIARARAPSPRLVQFFELRGNRAIRFGDWRAVAMRKCGTPQEQSRWMLFNLAQDFSESTDLSARYPDRLKMMQDLWFKEAAKYSDPPLGGYTEVMCGYSNYNDDFLKD